MPSADAVRFRTRSRPVTFESRDEADFARSTFLEAARDRPLDYGFIQRPDGKWTRRANVEGRQLWAWTNRGPANPSLSLTVPPLATTYPRPAT